MVVVIKNILGPADFSCKCYHPGDIYAKGTITSGAEYTALPNNFFYLFKLGTGDVSLFFVQGSDAVDKLVGGHVLGILAPALIQKTTVNTKGTMDTGLE